MINLSRSELIRRMVLNQMCDDYENVDQIIFPNVARDCAKLGWIVERSEIVGALANLVGRGLAAAYLLRPGVTGLEGMPEVEVEDETKDREFKTYFLVTQKGLDFHLSDDSWWPFDEEGDVLVKPQ